MQKSTKLTKAMQESPFIAELKDTSRTTNVNGKDMPFAVWNLICSKRDISLYTKINMKPHRHWKVSDVKWYFGIKGNGQNLLKEFMILFETVMGPEVEEA